LGNSCAIRLGRSSPLLQKRQRPAIPGGDNGFASNWRGAGRCLQQRHIARNGYLKHKVKRVDEVDVRRTTLIERFQPPP
jgi:hypothetical protein